MVSFLFLKEVEKLCASLRKILAFVRVVLQEEFFLSRRKSALSGVLADIRKTRTQIMRPLNVAIGVALATHICTIF